MPLTVTAGGVTASAAIGMENGATNGYDPGRDVPVPEDASTITAYFSHSEWGVKVAGKSLTSFYQDIGRGLSCPVGYEYIDDHRFLPLLELDKTR